MADPTPGADFLEVVCAWKITNPSMRRNYENFINGGDSKIVDVSSITIENTNVKTDAKNSPDKNDKHAPLESRFSLFKSNAFNFSFGNCGDVVASSSSSSFDSSVKTEVANIENANVANIPSVVKKPSQFTKKKSQFAKKTPNPSAGSFLFKPEARLPQDNTLNNFNNIGTNPISNATANLAPSNSNIKSLDSFPYVQNSVNNYDSNADIDGLMRSPPAFKIREEFASASSKLEIVQSVSSNLNFLQDIDNTSSNVSNVPKFSTTKFDRNCKKERDDKIHQVRLIHGTKPEYVYDILFDGLDPQLARNGLFGRGVYFAENAAKINQYVTRDEKNLMFQKKNVQKDKEKTTLLHRKLYANGYLHPKDVFYALVCKVALDKEPVFTKDGKTECGKDGKHKKKAKTRKSKHDDPKKTDIEEDADKAPWLFEKDSGRSKLADNSKHSLIALTGDRIKRFREFIVFEKDAIDIEYLVAFKRTRRYCKCGKDLIKRTVKNSDAGNRGRDIFHCPDKNKHKKCGKEFSDYGYMWPRCDCNKACLVEYTKDRRRFYKCGMRKPHKPWHKWKKCDFVDWNGPPS